MNELLTRTWLSNLFIESPLSDEARSNLRAGKLGADQADVGLLVYACLEVGENTIKDAIICVQRILTIKILAFD